jgi:hypothetical protein
LERLIFLLVQNLREQSEQALKHAHAAQLKQESEKLLARSSIASLDETFAAIRARFIHLVALREHSLHKNRAASELAEQFQQIELQIDLTIQALADAYKNTGHLSEAKLRASIIAAEAAVTQGEIETNALLSDSSFGSKGDGLAVTLQHLQLVQDAAVFMCHKLLQLKHEEHMAGVSQVGNFKTTGRHIFESTHAADAATKLSRSSDGDNKQEQQSAAQLNAYCAPEHIQDALQSSQAALDALFQSTAHENLYLDAQSESYMAGKGSPTPSAAYLARKLATAVDRICFTLVSILTDLPYGWGRYLSRLVERSRFSMIEAAEQELNWLDCRAEHIEQVHGIAAASQLRSLIRKAERSCNCMSQRTSRPTVLQLSPIRPDCILLQSERAAAVAEIGLSDLVDHLQAAIPLIIQDIATLYQNFAAEVHSVMPEALRVFVAANRSISSARDSCMTILGHKFEEDNLVAAAVKAVLLECPDTVIPSELQLPIAAVVIPEFKPSPNTLQQGGETRSESQVTQIDFIRMLKQRQTSSTDSAGTQVRTTSPQQISSLNTFLSPARRTRHPISKLGSLADARQRLQVLSKKLKTPMAWAATSPQTVKSPSTSVLASMRSSLSASSFMLAQQESRLKDAPSDSIQQFMSKTVDDLQHRLMNAAAHPQQCFEGDLEAAANTESAPASDLHIWMDQQSRTEQSDFNVDAVSPLRPLSTSAGSCPGGEEGGRTQSKKTTDLDADTQLQSAAHCTPHQSKPFSEALRERFPASPVLEPAPKIRQASRRPTVQAVQPISVRPTTKSAAAAAHQLFRMRRQKELSRLGMLMGSSKRENAFVRKRAA